MKNLWVLSIQTSLPDTCSNHEDLKKTFLVFDSFEKARTALQQELRKLAFSKNAMFDGAGKLNMLKNYYLYDEEIDESEYNDGFLGPTALDDMQNILLAIFKGENAQRQLACGNYDDAFIMLELANDSLRVFGVDDGPCNGYDPVLATNMFSTEKEKDYYLYIDDAFGQDDYSSELYIDLKKAEMDG